jgi:hypothetical protein
MKTTHDPGNSATDIDALNSLLLGQMAAVESYDLAINKFEDPHILTGLQSIREEHLQAEIQLREKVLQMGGGPVETSEPWGACSAAITHTEKVACPATALAALKQGEEHSINEFEDSLKNESISANCKQVVQTNLLPTGRKHVAELNRLMGGMS